MLIGAAKITDFPPLSEEEFKMLASQIQQHLSKGVPPSAPVQGLPMDALCRLIRTIIVLGQQSEQALTIFKQIWDLAGDYDKGEGFANSPDIRSLIAPFVLQGEDLVEFLSKTSSEDKKEGDTNE